MACHKIQPNVIVCGPDRFVDLAPYGAKVWCEYHNYLGPSFYRSEKVITEIRSPSRKTWNAFQKWRDEVDKNQVSANNK